MFLHSIKNSISYKNFNEKNNTGSKELQNSVDKPYYRVTVTMVTRRKLLKIVNTFIQLKLLICIQYFSS